MMIAVTYEETGSVSEGQMCVCMLPCSGPSCLVGLESRRFSRVQRPSDGAFFLSFLTDGCVHAFKRRD